MEIFFIFILPQRLEKIKIAQFRAVSKGHTEIVEKLIAAGVVVNYQNKEREVSQ